MVNTFGRHYLLSGIVLFTLALSGTTLSARERTAALQPNRESESGAMRTRLQQRFQLVPLHDGIALVPRFKSDVRSIEVSAGAIAVDGIEVTGSELRRKLGSDTDLVLQLSYLDATSRAALLGTSVQPPGPTPPADAPPRPARGDRRREAVVRFGGNVTVGENEIVTEDVVVIGGSADIDGQVDGDVVVVGGGAQLGPRADIRGDVTVIGGALNRDPRAIVGGSVNEVGVGSSVLGSGPLRHNVRFDRWWPFARVNPLMRLAGTFLRIGLLILLALVTVVIARTPVERIAERAAAEPIKAGIVGFLLELVFVPGLLVIIVFLAISIIGIPLLPLVPLAIVAFLIVLVLGFTGVAYWLGRQAERRFGWLRDRRYLATILGITAIVSPLILGRLIGLAGGFGFFAAALVGVGALLEYLGWTVGLGAAALVRFGAPLTSSGTLGIAIQEPNLSPEGPR